jgi:hypothetical protein
MTTAKGIRAGAAYVELTTKNSGLVKGLAAAEAKLKAFGQGIMAAGGVLTGLGTAALSPMIAMSKVFADMGSELVDMSQRTGVSVESLSELGYAAEQSGSNMAELESGLRKMQKQVSEAAQGSESAIEGFDKLGISVERLASMSPEQQFKMIADRISKLQDPTIKAAMAMELFGKSGTRLLPLITSGARGIEDLQQQARELGLTMSTEDAQAAEVFGDRMDALWKVLKQASFTVGAALAPTLIEAVQAMTRAAVATLNWVKANKPLIVMVAKIAAGVVVAGAALIGLGAAVYVAGAALGAIAGTIGAVGTVIGAIGSAIAFLTSPIGLAIAGVVALGGAFVYFSGAGGEAIKWLVGNFQWLRDTVGKTFQGISDAMAAGDMSLAAKVLWDTIQMEATKGIAALESHWLNFKNWFVGIWNEVGTSIASTLIDAFYSVQSAWVNVSAGMQTAWAETTTGMGILWDQFKNWLSTGSFELTPEQQDKHMSAAGQMSKENQKIEQDRKAAQERLRSQRSGAQTALQDDADRVAQDRIKANQGATSAREAELQQARTAWQKALAEAAAARAQAEKDGPVALKMPQLDIEGLDDIMATTKKKVDVVGTFNPLAAIGSDSLNERTAKATEQVAANTKKLIQQGQTVGAAFA